MDIHKVYRILEKRYHLYKTPVVELIQEQTKDPFKVLLATMLSARTQDSTTKGACKRLFKVVNNLEDLDKISKNRLQSLIYPVGFYRQKATHLKKWYSILGDKFSFSIPKTIDELILLPGVGRKTANLVLATAFAIPAICVDVHVHRICNRLGYVKTKTPFETEMKLREILPKEYWISFNTFLVAFGQNHCRPISPKCSTCQITDECQKVL